MKYTVVGYYGYGNTGDDDLLKQTVQLIRTVDPSNRITVTVRKNPISDIPKGISTVDRFSLTQLTRQLWRSNAVVFGGGGIFQDQTSVKSLIYYSSIVVISRLMQRPVFLLGQGISPSKHPLSKLLLRYTFSMCHWIGCRDKSSLLELKKIGCYKGHLTGDLAFYNRRPTLHPGLSPSVLLSLRPGNEELHTLPIKQYLHQEPRTIVGLTLQSPMDNDAIHAVYRDIKKDTPSILSLKGSFPHFPLTLEGSPQLVIAMRYHACIWAALNGIPFIALAYDDKVLSIGRDLGQSVIDLRIQNDPNALIDLCERIDSTRDYWQQLLLKKTLSIIQSSSLNESGLREWLTTH